MRTRMTIHLWMKMNQTILDTTFFLVTGLKNPCQMVRSGIWPIHSMIGVFSSKTSPSLLVLLEMRKVAFESLKLLLLVGGVVQDNP